MTERILAGRNRLITDDNRRWWTLPLVGPGVVGLAVAARVLDRALPDPDEALGFLVLARRHPGR